jgi:hypothetical protein
MAKREAFREKKGLKTASMSRMGNGHATAEKSFGINKLRDPCRGSPAKVALKRLKRAVSVAEQRQGSGSIQLTCCQRIGFSLSPSSDSRLGRGDKRRIEPNCAFVPR